MGVEPLNERRYLLRCSFSSAVAFLVPLAYYVTAPAILKGDFFMFKNALKLKKMSVAELCKVAMLVAITLVLSYISGYLRIGNLAKFNISFISVYVAGVAFGPVVSGVVAALADVISFAVNPTGAFVPVFTILEFANGFLFGLLLYCNGKDNKVKFVFMMLLCIVLQTCVNLFVRTYFLSELYFGGKYMATFISRVPSSLIMAGVKIVLMLMIEPFKKRIVKVIRD